MKNNNLFGYISTGFMTFLTVVQVNEIFQVIQLILTIISLIVTVSFTVWKWYKKASEDGEITKDEVDELMDSIKDVVDDKEKE